MLPTYYPRPTTVYNHFRRWGESNNMKIFLQRLVRPLRRKTGRIKSNFATSEFRPIWGRWVVERTNVWLENCRVYAEIMNDIFLQPER